MGERERRPARVQRPDERDGHGHAHGRARRRGVRGADVGDGEQAFKFFSSDPLEKLSFAYAPGEGDTGAALLSAFGASQGLTIILR